MNFLRHQLKIGKGIGFTLAANYNEENSTMSFGVAKCCKHDAFIKKKGREIASGRLNTNPNFTLPIPAESNLRDFFNTQFDNLNSELKKMNIKMLREEKSPNKVQEPSFELV